MPVRDADPAAVSLDAAFAAAMEGTPQPRDVPSPPDVDHDAPHGRGDDGQPLAPHGFNKDGSVRKSAAGRRPKHEQPRVITGTVVDDDDKGGKPELETKDYTGPLAEASEAIWVGLTFVSMAPLDRVPLIGAIPIGKDKATGQPRKLRSMLAGMEQKIAAQAAIFNENRGALVGALNIAANNNPRARRFADKLETGDVTWVLMCAAMAMPFVSQSGSLWSGTLEEDQLPPLDKLAGYNQKNFDAWIERFNAQLAAAAAAANAQMTEEAAA